MFIMNLWKHNEIFKKEVPQKQTSEESLISESKTDSSIKSLNSTESETQRSIQNEKSIAKEKPNEIRKIPQKENKVSAEKINKNIA